MSTTPDREADPGSRRIELYVRSLAARTGDGPQERAIERLRQLDAAGDVDSFSVRIWGERVGLSTTAIETERGRDILGRIGAFREWANSHDVSLAPFFESRRTTSRVTGEAYLTLRLPVLAMAEYEGGRLRHVTPHSDGGATRSVRDRLDRLNATEPPNRPAPGTRLTSG